MSPVRVPRGGPAVIVDASPAYEFVHTLGSLFEPRDTMEAGAEWFAEIERRAGPELMRRITDLVQGVGEPWYLLASHVYATPSPRDVASFLKHLRETDADDIVLTFIGYYERHYRRDLEPDVIRRAVAGDAEARREVLRVAGGGHWEEWRAFLSHIFELGAEAAKTEILAILEAWDERVWRHVQPTLMPILERDAEAKRELAQDLPLERFTEVATNGVEYLPRPGVRQVILVPSFAGRPWVTTTEYRDIDLMAYPVADESVSAETDAPPLRLIRLSKALADERRLRILRALGTKDMSLMELAEQFGVPKTTMHHHMIALRSAGLVTVRAGTKHYRLRHDALPDVGELLSAYLGPAAEPPPQPSPTPARAARASTGVPRGRPPRRRRPVATR